MTREKPRSAVVGSGVSGLTAAYVLRQDHRVTLYEADDRLGGHAHTHDIDTGAGFERIDTGFIVHNARTYPRLLRLFDELGVETQDSEMSMSVRCEGCGLEYAGARGARGLFARPASAADPRYLRMLTQVPRFHRQARRLLAEDDTGGAAREATLGEFLAAGRYSPYFVSHFMAPVVSAVWSCDPVTALSYPARYLFRFLDHHGMLSVSGSPTWRTVTGGSRSYVDRVAKHIPDVRTGTPVRGIRRLGAGNGVEITDAAGTTEHYDSVVLACHADQALALLTDPTEDERRVLGAFRYSRNPTLLHTDTTLLPRHSGARASWNYQLPGCDSPAGEVRISYDMTRLQRLPGPGTHVVTLNGEDQVDPDRVLARMVYHHPVYTPESVAAQRELPALSGRVTAFAGAHHGWGFHEDGCASGVAAAEALGVTW
ncbi:NAD(P)/FAD-dependent oxidoreductase [Streptomyces lonarensis]|uniref:FAD-dependent oxidoreductase n=1 Tax=Streptomyces lonarensis TaxID=700599 RepID=A0A7X6CYY7_9ACTN|nr:FAD-dependent oxidoreductase [Streptomyces lonarensis]NJQ05151.1 FAD-dependent oxidoreductase [Streptomyces lonarensis]